MRQTNPILRTERSRRTWAAALLSLCLLLLPRPTVAAFGPTDATAEAAPAAAPEAEAPSSPSTSKDAPATPAAEASPTDSPQDSLQLDDPVEPLVPLRPRTGREEDHVRALALFAAARVAEQKQDYEQALRNYQRTYRLDPDAVAALREIVPLSFNLGREEEGVRYAMLLAEREPADAGLLRRLAAYLTEDGETERALKFYEKAAALEDKAGAKPSAEAVLTWMEMGRLYFVAKQFDQAARYFAQVVSALENPKQFDLPSKVEEALLKRGELTYQLFGESFLEAGRVDEALAAFEKAQQLKDSPGQYLYNLARVDSKRKQPGQALAKLDRYFAGHYATQGTGPYELLEQLLAGLGLEDQLLKRLQASHDADPDNVPLAYFLGEQYRKAGKFDEAARLFAELIEKRGERPPLEAINGLVEVRRQQKDAGKLLDVIGETAARGRSLSPLGETGDALVTDQDLVRAVVSEAQARLKADAAKADYGQCLAAAQLALELQDFDTADQLFEAALKAEGAQQGEALVSWGLELFMANQYERAIKIFERALEAKAVPADNPALQFYLAGALEMSGRTEDALARAREAAELQPDTPRFASRAAWILFHAKRYDEARKEYKALLDKFDKNHESPEIRETVRDARLVLSNMSAIENNLPEAEEWLEQVLDEFPEDPGALNDLGYLWADADKHQDRALAMIQMAIDNDPKNMAYRDSLGWVLYRLGRYPEAIAELKVAASVDDPDGVILDHLAHALARNGDTAEAIAYWHRSIDAFEKSGETAMAAKARQALEEVEKQTAKPAEKTPAEAAPADDPAEPTDKQDNPEKN
jgi:tetratricopeptide (TPR) repeat protein